MKLVGKLKEKVEKSTTREDAKKVIEEAGMILDDAELEQVAGGAYSEDNWRNRRNIFPGGGNTTGHF